jgi:hypothetical protein
MTSLLPQDGPEDVSKMKTEHDHIDDHDQQETLSSSLAQQDSDDQNQHEKHKHHQEERNSPPAPSSPPPPLSSSRRFSSSTSSTSLREIKEKANQKLVKMRDRAIPITKKQKRSRYMPGKRYMPLLWIQWLWHPISVLLGSWRVKFHHRHDNHHHHHHHHGHEHRRHEGSEGDFHHGLVTSNDSRHDNDDFLLMD